MNKAAAYWNDLYSTLEPDCVKRGFNVACDFYTELRKHEDSLLLFPRNSSILEIGCGTGEFGRVTKTMFPHMKYLGIDVSSQAISYAKNNYGLYGLLFKEAEVFGINELFDIAFCSNTIEHFKNPHPMIERMLSLAKYVILLAPYNQDLTDGYDVEGGAGHVLTVTEQTFSRYNIIDTFTYFTHTWVVGADPKQIVIILKA